MSGTFLGMEERNKNHCPCETDHLEGQILKRKILKYVRPYKEKSKVKRKRGVFEAGMYSFS